MCGIVGFSGIVTDPSACLGKMIKTLNHRGPDDRGLWFDNNANVGLAHSRLSILDLSSAGHQPMHSQSGRFVIIFR